MAADAPLVFPGGNTKQGGTEETGDIAAGFDKAAHIVEATYSTHVIGHVCLETHGTVCEWDGDKLTAWISTQAVIQSAQGFAQGLGIPQANVHTITQYMGGGFGSKFAPDAQGIICAKLAQDREAAGQADARSQGRASRHRQPSVGDRAHPRRRHRRRHADRVRRPELGHRRRRRAERLPAAVHLQLSEPQAHAQGRLHQRRPAARDARAGTSAGLLPDGDPDGRARRSREDGSGRVPREEPAAGRAQRDVGRVLRARRQGVRLGQAPCDRRSHARADQDRHGRVGAPLGRRGPRIEGAHGHHLRRRRGDQVRHAGHRHRHADDRRDRRGGNARPAGQRREAGDRRLDAAVQRRLGRQHHRRVGDAGDPRDVGDGARRAVREGRADARRRPRRIWSPRAAASSSKARRRKAWRGKTPAS